MRAKAILAIVAVLVLAAPAFALDAPTWEPPSPTIRSGYVFLNWTDVEDATKYSVDIEGTVIYSDGTMRYTKEIKICFGTSDRTDGQPMSTSWLAIPMDDFADAVLAKLGVDPETVVGFQFTSQAKVKALNPGKGKGRQNHPFSEWADMPVITWIAPTD